MDLQKFIAKSREDVGHCLSLICTDLPSRQFAMNSDVELFTPQQKSLQPRKQRRDLCKTDETPASHSSHNRQTYRRSLTVAKCQKPMRSAPEIRKGKMPPTTPSGGITTLLLSGSLRMSAIFVIFQFFQTDKIVQGKQHIAVLFVSFLTFHQRNLTNRTESTARFLSE